VETFVASLVMTTVAPGTVAFCGSVTVPVIDADRIWPKAMDEHDRLTRINSEQSRCFTTTDLPSLVDPWFLWCGTPASHRCTS
jgi:hypothetical protein